MGNQVNMEEDKINIEEIKKSIVASGYLIEQRVEPIISKKGFYVETNDVYQDDETSKSREIDITAISGISIFEKEDHWLFPYLIIECENNRQPVVFFRSTTPISFLHHNEVKLSGTPVHVFLKNKEKSIRLNDFLNFEDFHHYCKGVFSTQYCSFQQTNKSNVKKWIALHTDSQHDSFQNIVKCLKYKIESHFKEYVLPLEGEIETANIQIYYPLLILQGEMYEAYIEKGELKLKSQNHIQFRKQIVKNGNIETFQIDIIKENYLGKYLSTIEKETDEIVKRLKRKKKVLCESIDIIINRLRDEPDKSKYIEILDFRDR